MQSKHFNQRAREIAPHLCDTSDEELKFQYKDSRRNLANFIADKDEDTLFRFFRGKNIIAKKTIQYLSQ